MEALLKDLGPKVASRLGDKALRAAAKPIVKDAKRLAPRRTGVLRRSIVAVKGKDKGGAYAATRTVLIGFKKPASSYAHLVEFGTLHSAAQPFIRPAMDARAQDALNEMVEVLSKGLLREEWKKSLQLLSEGQELDLGDAE